MHASDGAATQIRNAFAETGIVELPPIAYEQFETYLELLLRWNQRINLTAVREPEAIIRRHFVECAFAAQHLPRDITTLLDYGSGAGLPGIPVAICRPEIRVTLSEAQGKKIAFLSEARRVLGLSGEVYGARVETMPEQLVFDAVAMRAVEKLALAMPVAIQHAKHYLVLFTTQESAGAYLPYASELRWLTPIAIPNTEQMVLAIGQRA
jgi:16S rRNA (guanine527-N7)-methyltransferase